MARKGAIEGATVRHATHLDEESKDPVGIGICLVGHNETEVLRCRGVCCPVRMRDTVIVEDCVEPFFETNFTEYMATCGQPAREICLSIYEMRGWRRLTSMVATQGIHKSRI